MWLVPELWLVLELLLNCLALDRQHHHRFLQLRPRRNSLLVKRYQQRFWTSELRTVERGKKLETA